MLGRIKRQHSEKLPLLGRIKIGEKIKTKNREGKDIERPVSLDYFKAEGKYKYLFEKAYGEKPSRIQIAFVSDNIKEVCCESFVVRDGDGRKLAEGDGEEWEVWNEKTKIYEYKKAEKEDMEKMGKLEALLTLRFVIPKITGVFGVWALSSKGLKSTIPAIVDTYDMVLERSGTVANIMFDLVVEKFKSQKPGVASVYPVINLIPNITQDNMILLKEYLDSGQKALFIITDESIKRLAGPEQKLLQSADKYTAYTEIKSEPITEPKTEENTDDKSVVYQDTDTGDDAPAPPDTNKEAEPQVQAEPKSESKAEPKTEQGNSPKRPMSPAKLKSMMQKIAVTDTDLSDTSQLFKVRQAIDVLTNNNQKKSSIILIELFNHDKFTMITKGEAEAIIRWVKVNESTDKMTGKIMYFPDMDAVKEAELIYALYEKKENNHTK
jgi:hypothetical protein